MTIAKYYIYVNKNKSKTAPHKAVLLLTIMDMIETGEICSPFVQITDSLIENFSRVWITYVPSHSCYEKRIAYPFFHLASSPFWELVKAPSYKGQTEYSTTKALVRDFSGAIIDVGLFRMMDISLKRLYLDYIMLS